MKKLLTIGLAVLLILCMSVSLVGCSSCQNGEENRKKLAEIPKMGDYGFLQSLPAITYGDSYVSIQEEVHKAIKKAGKKIENERNCGFFYKISEDGKFMWFMAEYSHHFDSNDREHGKYKFAIGTTTLPNLNIKIEYYLPTQTYTLFACIGKLGDYFICRGEEDLLAIHLTTFENKTIDVREKEHYSLQEQELVLSRDMGSSMEYRIYDQTLTEYTISFDKNDVSQQHWYANVVEDYIFFYSSADKKHTCVCANYKTGERFTQEESYVMYESYFPLEAKAGQERYFIYKGKGYAWENEQYYIEKPAKDVNGKDIIQRIYYNKLVFEDLETGEKRELVPLEMNGDCALIMQKIFDIYGNELSWVQIIIQDDELFLVMVKDESFFFFPTSQTSPRIVFKYDESKSDLVYVGYAAYTYYEIERIYRM